MTKNKDLKRLVRARMRKTGESYTAARAQITGSDNAVSAPRASWPELAGQSDETMRKSTGRDWAEWVEVLDAIGATELTHTEIARYVRDELGIDAWWAQGVTVGYERIRGLRAKHQRRGGDFEASKSRTFSVPVAALFAAFADERGWARWLGAEAAVRTAKANKTMRLTWPDATSVEVSFTEKGPSKCAVTVTHKKLASAEAVAAAKAEWEGRLDRLAELLKG